MEDIPGEMGDDVERFLTEYCFGDMYTRGGLDLKTRELLGYCVLTTLEPTASFVLIFREI